MVFTIGVLRWKGLERMNTRRERLHAATRDEIKQIARAQMDENGATALSLNAIARAMEVVPSALYRYFPDRNALITALILDALAAFRAAVQSAVDAVPASQPAEQLLAAWLTYRRWALANPVEFELAFGLAHPNTSRNHAEIDVATFAVFRIYLDLIETAYQTGTLQVNPYFQPTTMTTVDPVETFGRYAPATMYTGIASWGRMHGLVMLELFRRMPSAVADRERFYEDEVRATILSWGLTFNTS
jgi:AcrR family transcriptional regulator